MGLIFRDASSQHGGPFGTPLAGHSAPIGRSLRPASGDMIGPMADRSPRSSVLFDLFAASQRVRSLLAAAMEGCGMRADEYAVYSALVEFEPLPPTEMAHVVGMPPTTMSHYVREMRERGHVEEEPNPRDGRSRMLRLTPAGRAAHSRANVAFEEAYARFVAGLPDVGTAKRSLEEIEAAAEEALQALAHDARGRAG
jgi:DNA-binding MarR family transcriptional regulator